MNVNSDFWHGKSVLVTGHTGFMGGWLVVVLKEFGARVIGYSFPPPTIPSFFDSIGLDELLDDDVRADVRDLPKLSNVVRERRKSSFILLRNRSSGKRFADPPKHSTST